MGNWVNTWRVRKDTRKPWQKVGAPRNSVEYRELPSVQGNKHGLSGLFIKPGHDYAQTPCVQCAKPLSYGRLGLTQTDLNATRFALAHYGCAIARFARARQWYMARLEVAGWLKSIEARRNGWIETPPKPKRDGRAVKLTRDYLRDLIVDIRHDRNLGNSTSVYSRKLIDEFRAIWRYRFECRIDRYGKPISPAIDGALADNRPIGQRSEAIAA